MDRIIKRSSVKPGCELLFSGTLYTVERVEQRGDKLVVDLAGFGQINLIRNALVAVRIPKRPRSPRAVPPPLSVSLSEADREWLTTMTGVGKVMHPADVVIYALHRYREEIEQPRRRRWPWRRLRAA